MRARTRTPAVCMHSIRRARMVVCLYRGQSRLLSFSCPSASSLPYGIFFLDRSLNQELEKSTQTNKEIQLLDSDLFERRKKESSIARYELLEETLSFFFSPFLSYTGIIRTQI
uniref:Uncharacterized protein n=1 Tax=Zea mays TaxID=4577 RepID=A0A804PNU7_MAIZE